MTKNNSPAKKDDNNVKSKWESVRGYVVSVWYELKKVHWPNRQQLIAYTGVVLFSVTVVALIIWVFDMGLSYSLEKLFEAF